MKAAKRIFSAFLILLMLNLYLPSLTSAEQHNSPAKAAITEHPPQILATPEEKIPTIEEKGSSWSWLIVLALAGGVAAAAGGGGGGGGGGGAPPPPTGTVTVGW